MKIDEIIRAWKNPEFRTQSNVTVEHPAGPSAVSDETLRSVGGAGSLHVTTTLDCVTALTYFNGCPKY